MDDQQQLENGVGLLLPTASLQTLSVSLMTSSSWKMGLLLPTASLQTLSFLFIALFLLMLQARLRQVSMQALAISVLTAALQVAQARLLAARSRLWKRECDMVEGYGRLGGREGQGRKKRELLADAGPTIESSFRRWYFLHVSCNPFRHTSNIFGMCPAILSDKHLTKCVDAVRPEHGPC